MTATDFFSILLLIICILGVAFAIHTIWPDDNDPSGPFGPA